MKYTMAHITIILLMVTVAWLVGCSAETITAMNIGFSAGYMLSSRAANSIWTNAFK